MVGQHAGFILAQTTRALLSLTGECRESPHLSSTFTPPQPRQLHYAGEQASKILHTTRLPPSLCAHRPPWRQTPLLLRVLRPRKQTNSTPHPPPPRWHTHTKTTWRTISQRPTMSGLLTSPTLTCRPYQPRKTTASYIMLSRRKTRIMTRVSLRIAR